jgi:hypothetical protein
MQASRLGCSCPISNLGSLGSNLSPETRFPRSCRNIPKYYPKMGHNSFLPLSFKFFILSHVYSTLVSQAVEEATLKR